jgi:hypothetical protein
MVLLNKQLFIEVCSIYIINRFFFFESNETLPSHKSVIQFIFFLFLCIVTFHSSSSFILKLLLLYTRKNKRRIIFYFFHLRRGDCRAKNKLLVLQIDTTQ